MDIHRHRMSIFAEQYLLNTHPYTTEEYLRVWPNDTIDWPTDLLHIYSDNASSWIPPANALGLTSVHGSELESVWTADQLVDSSTTSMLDNWQNGVYLSNPSKIFPFHTTTDLWQHSAPHYGSARAETVPTWVGETAVPHSVQKTCCTHPTGKQIGDAPRLRTARLRRNPYSVKSDGIKRGFPLTSFYQCQWSNGAGPCAALVAGTKNAIAHHLQTVHGIRLKADKIYPDHICLWDGCQKSMRRESIPRHVLAVHLKDKVHCPSCGSQFARPDSLRRHRKTCQVNGEDASESDPQM